MKITLEYFLGALTLGLIGILIGAGIYMFESCFKNLYIAYLSLGIISTINIMYFLSAFKLKRKYMIVISRLANEYKGG